MNKVPLSRLSHSISHFKAYPMESEESSWHREAIVPNSRTEARHTGYPEETRAMCHPNISVGEAGDSRLQPTPLCYTLLYPTIPYPTIPYHTILYYTLYNNTWLKIQNRAQVKQDIYIWNSLVPCSSLSFSRLPVNMAQL